MSITMNDIDFVLKPPKEPILYDVKPLARVVAFHNRPPSLGVYDTLMPLRPGASPKSQFEDDFEVQQCDIEYAEEIAEYYKHKLVTRALTQTNQDQIRRTRSTFDRDLGQALRLNDEFSSKEEYFPILHRLPDFYIEDQAIDEMVLDHVSHPGHCWSVLGNNVIVGELSFVRKVQVKKRAYKVMAFYFADKERHLVRIPVPSDSVTMPALDLLSRSKSFIMIGNTTSRSLHRDYRDFDVLEPVGPKWEITDLEM